jgi:hypothetical protein
MKKLERVVILLKNHWGFTMWKNKSTARGYWSGACKTGYTVNEDLRGFRWIRFDSLDQIIRRYELDKIPSEQVEAALKNHIEVHHA